MSAEGGNANAETRAMPDVDTVLGCTHRRQLGAQVLQGVRVAVIGVDQTCKIYYIVPIFIEFFTNKTTVGGLFRSLSIENLVQMGVPRNTTTTRRYFTVTTWVVK